MAETTDADGVTILRFPVERRECASIESVTRLAPPRSLVDTLIAEAGMVARDAAAEMAAAFAHQARALEAGFMCDDVITKLRTLVDAHIAYAADICRDYQVVADELVDQEVKAAQAERLDGRRQMALHRARANFRGRAIAARIAADAAQGAVRALACYIRNGVVPARGAPAQPEQLALFASAG